MPWGLGPDAGGLGPEEDAERDEVGDAESSRNHTEVSSEARRLTSSPLCKSEDLFACTLLGRRDFDVAFFAAPSDSITSESESSMASAAVDRGRLEGALGGSISPCLGAVGEFFGCPLNSWVLPLDVAESGSVRAGGTPKYPFCFVEVFSVGGTPGLGPA